MQNEQQKRTKIAKRIIIVAIVLVAIFAIGVGVALLLRNVSQLASNGSPKSTDRTSNTPVAPGVPSAASLISGYIMPENMRAFAEEYQLQQDATAPSRISYTAENKQYEVSLSTSSYAMFYAKDGAAHNDAAIVASQTTNYMSSKGFRKSSNAPAGSNTTTYADQGSVCQLTSTPSSKPAYYLMACADRIDVDKEYASIEKLLDVYRKSHQLDTFTRAITSTVTSDNKSMTTIALTTKTHPVLLFAAVDADWEYIGDVGGGDAMTSNGKYSLTPQIQTAIHKQKYGNFLTSNLQ
jgi:flagellar basal body-associated protein FliL